MAPSLPVSTADDQPAQADQLLAHLRRVEEQFQQIRQGLTHSHRLATLGTLTSIIAHEYNNILTPVISYAQLALANPQDVELLRKAVEKSLAGAERAAHISASLLGFAREHDPEPVALLPQVVEDSLACLGRHPSKDGIELVVDVPVLYLAISPLSLQQVLLNLLLNARKAMRRKGGTLTIRATAHGPRARITVADTGPGIPSAIADRLFEPFVTHATDTHESPSDPKGTGLGLCICRELVQNAGGTIEVESHPGRGATFIVTLPRAEAAPKVKAKGRHAA